MSRLIVQGLGSSASLMTLGFIQANSTIDQIGSPPANACLLLQGLGANQAIVTMGLGSQNTSQRIKILKWYPGLSNLRIVR